MILGETVANWQKVPDSYYSVRSTVYSSVMLYNSVCCPTKDRISLAVTKHCLAWNFQHGMFVCLSIRLLRTSLEFKTRVERTIWSNKYIFFELSAFPTNMIIVHTFFPKISLNYSATLPSSSPNRKNWHNAEPITPCEGGWSDHLPQWQLTDPLILSQDTHSLFNMSSSPTGCCAVQWAMWKGGGPYLPWQA